ncbi:hypothetical protein ACP4OV_026777 [Aristida adscensionis]
MMDGARENARRATSHPTHHRVHPGDGAYGGEGGGGCAAAASDGHYEGSGLVDQDPDPSLHRLTEAILKAIEDRRCQEEEAAAAVTVCSPSSLAALEIITRPSLVLPLAVITTMAVALSHGWLKLELVDLGEIVKDLYGGRREY